MGDFDWVICGDKIADAGHSAAIRDIIAERNRQISVKGWTAKHDDTHTEGELARAAHCYAAIAGLMLFDGNASYNGNPPFDNWAIYGWPWDRAFWRPGPVRRMLVKAAALIVAQIEVIDRAQQRKDASHG